LQALQNIYRDIYVKAQNFIEICFKEGQERFYTVSQ